MMVKYFSGARCAYSLQVNYAFSLEMGVPNVLYKQVTTTIYNLILGKVYCDHHGTMNIRGNCQYSCKLKFKDHSLLERNPRQVRR